MDWTTLTIGVILILVDILSIYIGYSAKKIAENNADILQNREKEYEAEKGRNLATKEDIEEITRKMEDVKSVVSLSNQKQSDKLSEQERILVDILAEANSITTSWNKYYLYLFDTSTRRKFDDLVEMVTDRMTKFDHLCNLAKIKVDAESLNTQLEELGRAITLIGIEITTNSTNAASLIDEHLKMYDYAMTSTSSDEEKVKWMQMSLESKRKIESMRNDPSQYKEEMGNAINAYREWLRGLYGQDFFMIKKESLSSD